MSPQAKGRVERAYQTLQDRLVKNLRLAGINDYQRGEYVSVAISLFTIRAFAVQAILPADCHEPLRLKMIWTSSLANK